MSRKKRASQLWQLNQLVDNRPISVENKEIQAAALARHQQQQAIRNNQHCNTPILTSQQYVPKISIYLSTNLSRREPIDTVL